MPKNKHAQALGRKGGQSKSEAKVKAARENAKKATAAREAKRKNKRIYISQKELDILEKMRRTANESMKSVADIFGMEVSEIPEIKIK